MSDAQRMSADDVQRCVSCNKKAAHNMIFYIIQVDQAVVDLQAVQQQVGLEMMVGGNAMIAGALGDRDVIQYWNYGSGQVHVCNNCMLDITLGEIMSGMEDR